MDPITSLAVKIGKAITKSSMIAIETQKEKNISKFLHQMNPLGNIFFYDIKTKKCNQNSTVINDYLTQNKEDLKKFFYEFLKITGNSKYFTTSILGGDIKKISNLINNNYEINYAHYIIYFVDSGGNVSFYSILTGKTCQDTDNFMKEDNIYYKLNDDVITVMENDGDKSRGFDLNFETLRNNLIKLENPEGSNKYTNSDDFKTRVGVKKSLILLNFEKLCQILHFYFCGAAIDIFNYNGRKPELIDLSIMGNFKYPGSHRLHYTRLGPFTGISKEDRKILKQTYNNKITIKKPNIKGDSKPNENYDDENYNDEDLEENLIVQLDIDRFKGNVDTDYDTDIDFTSLDLESLKILLKTFEERLNENKDNNDIEDILLTIKIQELNKIITQKEPLLIDEVIPVKDEVIPVKDIAVVAKPMIMKKRKHSSTSSLLGGSPKKKPLKQKIREFFSFDNRVQPSFKNVNNAAHIAFSNPNGMFRQEESKFRDIISIIANYLQYGDDTSVQAIPFNPKHLNIIYENKTNEYINETFRSMTTNIYNPSSWNSCANNIYFNFTEGLINAGRVGRGVGRGGGNKSKIMSKKINKNRNKNINKTKKLSRNK